jgi:hypothetical protein
MLLCENCWGCMPTAMGPVANHIFTLLCPRLSSHCSVLHTPPQSVKDHLLALFDWLVPVSLRFVRREVS